LEHAGKPRPYHGHERPTDEFTHVRSSDPGPGKDGAEPDVTPGASQAKGSRTMLKSIWQDEDGLTTVEYALLLALVAIAAIAAWTTLGQRTSTTVSSATNSLPTS